VLFQFRIIADLSRNKDLPQKGGLARKVTIIRHAVLVQRNEPVFNKNIKNEAIVQDGAYVGAEPEIELETGSVRPLPHGVNSMVPPPPQSFVPLHSES
jgi:hypothetical protein